MTCVTVGKPPSTDAVLEWFSTQELPRGVGFDEDSKPYDWFHGENQFYYLYSSEATMASIMNLMQLHGLFNILPEINEDLYHLHHNQ